MYGQPFHIQQLEHLYLSAALNCDRNKAVLPMDNFKLNYVVMIFGHKKTAEQYILNYLCNSTNRVNHLINADHYCLSPNLPALLFCIQHVPVVVFA